MNLYRKHFKFDHKKVVKFGCMCCEYFAFSDHHSEMLRGPFNMERVLFGPPPNSIV